jgi:ABC-type multidrug transport system fused ATPase/permease subunit
MNKKNIHRTKEVITSGEKEIINEVEEETTSWIQSIPSYVAILIALVAVVTAIVGVASYRQQGANYLQQSAKDLSARLFESQKPFFDKQTEFYVDAMQTVSKLATKGSPATQGSLGSRAMSGGELLQDQPSEQAREHAHGEEEAGPAGDPALTIERDAAARHDHVDMRMRAPGMEDGEDADAGAKVFGIGRDGDQSLGEVLNRMS